MTVYHNILKLMAFIAFIYVLFSDIFPSVYGSYADQRLMLVFFLGFFVVSGCLVFSLHDRVALSQYYIPLALMLLLALAFIFLVLPFSGLNPYTWAEPGMYSLFFTAIVFSAVALVLT